MLMGCGAYQGLGVAWEGVIGVYRGAGGDCLHEDQANEQIL